jgi:hypothetical protein
MRPLSADVLLFRENGIETDEPYVGLRHNRTSQALCHVTAVTFIVTSNYCRMITSPKANLLATRSWGDSEYVAEPPRIGHYKLKNRGEMEAILELATMGTNRGNQ